MPASPAYAAYATNLDPEVMSSKAPHSPMRSTGWLLDWRLTFGGEDRDPWLLAAGCETRLTEPVAKGSKAKRATPAIA